MGGAQQARKRLAGMRAHIGGGTANKLSGNLKHSGKPRCLRMAKMCKCDAVVAKINLSWLALLPPVVERMTIYELARLYRSLGILL